VLEDAASQKPQEFAVAYHLGEAEAAVGANDKAAAAFQSAAALDPKSAPAEFGWARALARQQKVTGAAPHYRQAAALDPTYRDGLIELASLYEKSGQTQEAAALYRELPGNPEAEKRLSNLQLRSGQYADAIPNLEQAYARESSPANLIALAAAYAITGQTAKALPLLEKAAAAEPANFDVRMMYGRALRDSKQIPAAVAQFNEAVKLKPGDKNAWSDFGAALYAAAQYPQSLAAFDKARELGEDTPGNWFLRAITLDKLQQKKPALEAYRKFLEISRGEHPDQEFQARQRARILQTELEKR
jgi:tetratricopeptide (TPR) repeat protein